MRSLPLNVLGWLWCWWTKEHLRVKIVSSEWPRGDSGWLEIRTVYRCARCGIKWAENSRGERIK